VACALSAPVFLSWLVHCLIAANHTTHLHTLIPFHHHRILPTVARTLDAGALILSPLVPSLLLPVIAVRVRSRSSATAQYVATLPSRFAASRLLARVCIRGEVSETRLEPVTGRWRALNEGQEGVE